MPSMLEPTFSTAQVGQMVGRTAVWVQHTARRLGLGRLEGKALRLTGAELARIAQEADPNETRGRKA